MYVVLFRGEAIVDRSNSKQRAKCSLFNSSYKYVIAKYKWRAKQRNKNYHFAEAFFENVLFFGGKSTAMFFLEANSLL